MAGKAWEHRRMPVANGMKFAQRMAQVLAWAVGITAFTLAVGMLGYHRLEGLPWLDAFLDAAMILGGMGPVDPIQTPGGKLFAGLYALFCGLVFIGVSGLVFAPVFHRVLHRFHVPEDKD